MKLAFIFLLLASSVLAEDIYIAQNALGGEMSSAGTATNLAWFNTAANWGVGASKISSGDTVHFVGTMTNEAVCQSSGTAGSPVTLYAEAGAKWILSGGIAKSAINLSNYNYLTVDGGPDSYITYTDNGTLLSYQAATYGVYGSPSIGNIEVKNLRITNIFVFNTGSVYISDYGSGVRLGSGAYTNVSVHNCSVEWATRGVYLTYVGTGSHTWHVYSNSLQKCNWGAGGGDESGGSTLVNLYVHHNTIDGSSSWNSTGDPNYHENGTYFWAELGGGSSGSYISNSYYYANRIGPNMGSSTTAHIFTSASGGKGIFNCNIYNNVILGATSYGLLMWNGSGYRVFNNSIFSGPGSGANIAISQLVVTGEILHYNNLFYAVGAPENITYETTTNSANTFRSDYNSFFALNPFGGAWGNLAQWSFSVWQGTLGHDTHAITSNPLVTNTNTYDLHIATNSPAIAAGTNLNVLGYPGVGVDLDGLTRPVSSAWAIGAYEAVFPTARIINVSGEARVGQIIIP